MATVPETPADSWREVTQMSESIVDTVSHQTGETLLDVQDLKTYYEGGGLFGGDPVKAVDGVNFEIARGETFGLVGESGCGKTTLGRTLIQLETATSGTVSFDGTDITELSGGDLKQWRRNAQMVFQDPESSLNDRMTVGEIIREPLDVHEQGTARERREKVRTLLDEVGLMPEHYYRYPHQFSGGQRQRIGIARHSRSNRSSSSSTNPCRHSTCPSRPRYSICWRNFRRSSVSRTSSSRTT